MNCRRMLLVSLLFVSACSSRCISAETKIIQNGIQVELGDLNVKVQFYAPGIVRVVKWLPGTSHEATPDSMSLVVIQKTLPGVNIQTQKIHSSIVVKTEKLGVRISTVNGSLTFLSKDNMRILSEAGKAAIIPVSDKLFQTKQDFSLDRNEAIYGLGQHQYGYMNYRGRTVTLVQSNTDAVTPFLVSTNNYGILWDNYSKTIFEDTKKGTSIWSDAAGNIDYYFIFGESIDSVIAGYRNLTGRAPMYGKWAYGYWQSKEHYENREELLRIANEFRIRKIPIDNIIQDWDYWDGGQNWGQLFFDEKKYPNPKEMIDSLHRQNFHVMISIWPGLGPNTPVFKDMQQRGFLYPPTGWGGFKYFDAYNPAADDLYWDYMNKGLFSKGIDAWWMDSTEPDLINALSKESTEYEMKRLGKNYLGPFSKYLNPYSLLITDAVYRNQRTVTDQKRVYILTRSTFAGQQRAAATTWSGDIGASWSIYKNQIPAGLNHCMAGIPYWTFDIGAFVIGSYGGVFPGGGKDPAYQELYTRMFQFGTFCPIFRSHGSETPREPWEFGDFTPILIKFDNLRYRLLPYIYSLAHQVTDNGYTIMRGLAMDFGEDKRTYSIDDQFMFGPAMMVCPVTDYMLHRPPLSSIPVTPGHFKTDDGKPGLKARYYKDTEYKNLSLEKIDTSININWYATGRPDYVTDSTLSIQWTGKLIPSQTGKHRFHIKCFGPKRIFIDGKELPFVYRSVEVYTDTINLVAGKKYDFALETENYTPGALRVELYWKTPEIFAKELIKEKKAHTRKVYVPTGARWYDFWTGKIMKGGRTATMDAPIDKIPILVKAGSIVPMGPFVQYATEKPADPVELRIYPGANGTFTLYEDENDNYNYEKGIYATITFTWDDANRRLTIGKRQGSFPGMLQQRFFNIVMMRTEQGRGQSFDSSQYRTSGLAQDKGQDQDRGLGVGVTENPDKITRYQGEEQIVQF